MVAEDWIENKRERWSSRYAEDTRAILDRELFPALGERPISEIAPPVLLDVIRKIERRDAPAVAEKVLSIARQVMRHAVRIGCLVQGVQNNGTYV